MCLKTIDVCGVCLICEIAFARIQSGRTYRRFRSDNEFDSRSLKMTRLKSFALFILSYILHSLVLSLNSISVAYAVRLRNRASKLDSSFLSSTVLPPFSTTHLLNDKYLFRHQNSITRGYNYGKTKLFSTYFIFIFENSF